MMLVCSNRSEDAAQPPVYKLCDSSVSGLGMPKSELAADRSFPISSLKSWSPPADELRQPEAPHLFLPSPPGFPLRSCSAMSAVLLSVHLTAAAAASRASCSSPGSARCAHELQAALPHRAAAARGIRCSPGSGRARR